MDHKHHWITNLIASSFLLFLSSCGGDSTPPGPPNVPVAAPQPPQDIQQKLSYYVAFSELMNLIRFYYPGDEAASVNWENFTLAGMKRIEQADDNETIESILKELFLPIAPSLSIQSEVLGQAQPEHPDAYTFWHHNGFAFGYTWADSGASFYSNQRIIASDPDQSVYFPTILVHEQTLSGGIEVSFPIAIAVENGKTQPQAAGFTLDESTLRYNRSFNDLYVRLTSAAILWGNLQHFFPYKKALNLDWSVELPLLLSRSALDSNLNQLVISLKLSVAKLQDNHSFFVYSQPSSYSAPFSLDWIESQAVVTEVFAEAQGVIEKGYVLSHIDGISVEILLAELDPLITTGSAHKRAYGVYELLKRQTQSSTYRFLDNFDQDMELTLSYGATNVWIDTIATVLPKPESDFFEVEPGIFYLDLVEWQGDNAAENSVINQLLSARGVVIDWRGYPNSFAMQNRVLSILCPEELPTPAFLIHHQQIPNGESLLLTDTGWSVLPSVQQSSAKVALITGRNTQSAADTGAALFQKCSRAQLVGEATTGANGNITGFYLFGRPENGGLRINFSGMEVLQNDGSRLIGIGVQPDVPVILTRQGVTNQIDESFQKALEIVR